MAERDLTTITTEELYAFKDRLKIRRDEIKGRRGPGPSHTRHYCRTMLQQINAILRKRNAPLRRPGSSTRVYGPGNAHWQKEPNDCNFAQLLLRHDT